MPSEPARVAGLRRPPASARTSPAELVADGGRLNVTDATGVTLASAAFDSVEVSARVGGIPRTVTFPDGSVFETRDNDAIDAIPALGRRGRNLAHRLERFGPRLFVFAALAIGLALGFNRFGVPLLVDLAVKATPQSAARMMSHSALSTLDLAVFGPTQVPPPRQRKLTAAFAALAAADPTVTAAGTASRGFTLLFRRGRTIGANAFALPDGTVVLTDELATLVDDDEAILGVLAHEIGHVVHRHTLRQLYRNSALSAFAMMIGGDIGADTGNVLVQGSALLALSYSRDAEREADRFSVELMHATGRDPAAIARFLEALHDLGPHDGLLSTHPATRDRIADVRRYADTIAARGNAGR